MAMTGTPGRYGLAEPANGASPKANTEPSDPASQYPPPSGVTAIAVIGPCRWAPAREP